MSHYVKASFALLLVTILNANSSFSQKKLNIIPQPNHVEIKNDGAFQLSSESVLVASGESKSVAQFFQNSLNQDKNLQLKISKKSSKQQILFKENTTLNKEAYQIEVNVEKNYHNSRWKKKAGFTEFRVYSNC